MRFSNFKSDDVRTYDGGVLGNLPSKKNSAKVVANRYFIFALVGKKGVKGAHPLGRESIEFLKARTDITMLAPDFPLRKETALPAHAGLWTHPDPLQLLRLVEEQAQIGLWSVDLRTGVKTYSQGVFRITGLKNEDGLNAIQNLVHPDDWNTREEMSAALAAGIPIHREFRIIRPDRTVRWLELKADVVLGGDARPLRADGIIYDITVRKETAQTTERSQARYRGLVQTIASVVWLMNGDGRRWPCPSWVALTGQTDEEWLAGGWSQAIHPDDRPRAKQAWQTAFERVEPYEANYRLRHADGIYRWVHSRAVPLLDGTQGVREWIGVIIDMTRSATVMSTPKDDAAGPISGNLVRSARAMLDWSISDLAAAAAVSSSSIKRLEEGGSAALRPRTCANIRAALENGGVAFVETGPGEIGLVHRPAQAKPIATRIGPLEI